MAEKVFKLCKRKRLSTEERNLLLVSKDLLNKSWKENIVHNYLRHGAKHGIDFYKLLIQYGHDILNVNSHGDNCFYTLLHQFYGYPGETILHIIDTAAEQNKLDELMMGERFNRDVLSHPDGHLKILKRLHHHKWLKLKELPGVKNIEPYNWLMENFTLTVPKNCIIMYLQNGIHTKLGEDGSVMVIRLFTDFPQLIVPNIMKTILCTGATWDNVNYLKVYEYLLSQGYKENWGDFFMTLFPRCNLPQVKELLFFLLKNKEISDFHWKYAIALNLTEDITDFSIKYSIWDIYRKELHESYYRNIFRSETELVNFCTQYSEENCKLICQRVKELLR